ncbi:peptidoglycan-binding domain-containing protein [Agromyces archimandritae]|uniref:Peptidoglycan-binding protein n=1 Tax=Agromyces archimandritae TaxID=2781962 RepID=A0A975IMP6_9MICO|nr:peptidoglycan-binding protein [Agromyces archimandritae]QTX03379.1 peptidoglycan-binding protein [Agromyces archimandritae]
MPEGKDAKRRRWPAFAAVGVAVLLVGGVAGWAAAEVFAPRTDVIAESPFTFVELVEGEVGSSITLNTVAEWKRSPAGTNQAQGTVTAVRATGGDEVGQGGVLYEVDLRPVVAAAGATPAFRALSRGIEGADVAQLQTMLAALGFYDGEADGEFGAQTQAAARAWQESLGLDGDGTVRAGDLVFIPSLPARVTLDTEVVSRGALLTGGEAVVSGLSPEPVFTIPATVSQAAGMPAGTAVEITFENSVWSATVAGQTPSPDSGDQVDIALQGVDGAPVCGDECGLLPIEGQNLLSSRIITQETVRGIVAPSAALRSDADGAVSVIDEGGDAHPVRVVASARGMSVVEGVDAGIKVRIPASTAGAVE